MDQRFAARRQRFVTGGLGELEIRAIQMGAERSELLGQGLVQGGRGARVSRLDGSRCPGLCKPAPRRFPVAKKKLMVVKGSTLAFRAGAASRWRCAPGGAPAPG